MTNEEVMRAFRSLLDDGDLTCTVSDALGRTGALSADFRPVWPGARLIGEAVTVRTFGTDLSAVFDGIQAAVPGSVLIIDSHGIRNAAFWGERTTRMAQARGLAGTVIDGACRDVVAISRLQYPVFSTAITPNAGLPGGRGSVNQTVQAGGIPVQPQDLVIADENGVVVIPQALASEILQRVHAALDDERKAFVLAAQGASVPPSNPRE
ncbi:RraA family protein [Deinococcus peraridilitoris]|uniref:Regulator of ribonuclease activity homolog n=1 Tax=Deinococcus peraridilitoris (strain DSM 19664 / LMG 22246 / CIP 109416 / KR-200) TaxID=937777 RepID=L0A966_DEIPD|nr:RraA family protein [Deinococcus peraridilitoris]AFZ69667.1 Demethylmenaquinone methyltransferase [Deinococcus peraridilitoris DSM 19664]